MARKNYPGHIRKRGDAFQIRLEVKKRQHTFTVQGVTRREAELIATEKAGELRRRAVREEHGLPTTPRFSELLKEYQASYLPGLSPGAQRSYRESLKPIARYWTQGLSDPHVDQVYAHQILGYLTWRRFHSPTGIARSKPLHNRTLAKDRAVLHRVFSIAVKLEYIDRNPVAKIDPPDYKSRDPVLLTDREYDQILWACRKSHPMLHLWVMLLGETGCRAYSEALWLRWEDVDLTERFIWFDSSTYGRRTKSGRGRWVPMTSRLRQAINTHFTHYRFASYDKKRSPWVFHHLPGFKGSGVAGERIRSMRDRFNRVRQSLEISNGFVPHDLRHRRATSWIGAGKDVVKVKEALGHADLRTTMGYTHLAREHLRSLVEEADDSHDPVVAASVDRTA
ncbi:MAG: tyrosine-type recombinase/integrase [bacterium]